MLIRGRTDAILGNLIIEFEFKLTRHATSEAEKQLKNYTAILWNNKGIVDYKCMASDGLIFHVYSPRSSKERNFESEDIVLDPIDSLDLTEKNSASIFKWLGRCVLYRTLIPPTTEDIVNYFGLDSGIFKDILYALKKLWRSVKGQTSAAYNEWAKYLSIVYGSDVDNEDLFLRHTYLATLSKIMVYSYYSGGAMPKLDKEMEEILKGSIFKKWGIHNFLEEDFFSWIIQENSNSQGISIASTLIDALARYDLTKINQDILKGLYQQLVDPKERHDLGEFYTPDWLAELIVKEVVRDPKTKILDPACGSGSFLVSTIRQKNKLLKIEQSKKLEIIANTVHGIDVHPLAILISKANYLMALGVLIKYKKDGITIRIYMSDSILSPNPTLDVARGIDIYLYPVDKKQNFAIP